MFFYKELDTLHSFYQKDSTLSNLSRGGLLCEEFANGTSKTIKSLAVSRINRNIFM
jgi:hypothetical protein